ncbi:MAG: hypothetical protein AB2L07_15340 [Thermoanaerobaculaceae bacterium]
MRARFLSVLVAMLLAAGARAGDRWFNLQVNDPTEPVEVSVRVPMPLVEAALDGVHGHRLSHGRLHLGCDRHRVDWQSLLGRVQTLPDGGEASFRDGGADIRAARRGELVTITVDAERSEHVIMSLPAALVDALSVDADQLDLRAFARKIHGLRGELLRVDADGTTVRMWVEEL